mgnify:CR=1 FL=1
MGDYKRSSDTNKVYNRTISIERKQSGFKGIFIPVEMLEYNDGTLSLTELFVLEEIEYFCRVGRYKSCIVKNEHFMDVIGVSERTVMRAISHLESLGAITISQKRGIRVIKYNYEEFKPKYADVEYEDNLYYDDTTICPDEVTNSQEGVTISQEGVTNSQNLHYKEENKEENKEGAQAPPVPPKNHSRLYSEERKTLSDELHSQEEIQKQTKERKKQSVEDKCYDVIDKSPFSAEAKDLLRQYFDWNYHSSSPKRVRQKTDWSQKVKRLEQLQKQGEDIEKVIKQSLDNQWYGFFEYKEQVNSNTEKHENFTEGMDNWSLEEAQAEYDRKKQLVAEGKLKVY